jgi:hypothetical protein
MFYENYKKKKAQLLAERDKTFTIRLNFFN